jgi:mRNA interferase ChpB
MKRGEIWLVRDRRPVLIVSHAAFNRHNETPDNSPDHEAAVISRGQPASPLPLTGAGIKTTGVVRCDQPCTLDLARGGRKLESLPDAIMDEVLARVSPIFE